MLTYSEIFEHNQRWIADKTADDHDYFVNLAKDQNPSYLYIGCSDSRVPANEIMGLAPGEVFVHRNIANLVNALDLNAASVIHYAVEYLGVEHIIVCGHYNCGGVNAAMQPKDLGILNPWLRNIRDVYRLHAEELDAISDPAERSKRLVEINVEEQCFNVIKMAEVQKNFFDHGFPQVHGWVFDLSQGLIKDLKLDFDKRLRDIQAIYNLKG